eukprot:4368773-Pleurochrysis_carterae.AAC.2
MQVRYRQGPSVHPAASFHVLRTLQTEHCTIPHGWTSLQDGTCAQPQSCTRSCISVSASSCLSLRSFQCSRSTCDGSRTAETAGELARSDACSIWRDCSLPSHAPGTTSSLRMGKQECKLESGMTRRQRAPRSYRNALPASSPLLSIPSSSSSSRNDEMPASSSADPYSSASPLPQLALSHHLE